jgi:hypothetical protein
MKTLKFVILVIVSVAFVSCGSSSHETPVTDSSAVGDTTVAVDTLLKVSADSVTN